MRTSPEGIVALSIVLKVPLLRLVFVLKSCVSYDIKVCSLLEIIIEETACYYQAASVQRIIRNVDIFGGSLELFLSS